MERLPDHRSIKAGDWIKRDDGYWALRLTIGNDDTPTKAALSTFTELQSSVTAAGSTTFNVTKDATGRYVLIWITYLPPRAGDSSQYESLIYNVILHGSVVSQSG